MMTMGHVVALLSAALSGGVAVGKVEDNGDDVQQCHRLCRHDDRDHHLAGCCVCISRFRDGEDIRRLPCGHAFHRDCVNRWLALCRRTTCPLCRLHVGAGAGVAAEDDDQHQLSDDLVIWFSSLFVAGL